MKSTSCKTDRIIKSLISCHIQLTESNYIGTIIVRMVVEGRYLDFNVLKFHFIGGSAMLMWRHTSQTFILALVAMFFIVGCSSGGGSIPTLPDTSTGSGDDLALTDGSQDYGTDRNADSTVHSLIGYVQVYYDPATGDLEIVPVREAETHWNILKFMEKGPCYECFQIVGIQYSDHESWLIDFQVSNPFEPMEITIFDVRGIMMFPGSQTFPEAGLTGPNMQSGDGYNLNAEGFTTLYNPSTFGEGPGGFQGYYKGDIATDQFPDCDINPFKYFITDDPANTRNALYGGGSAVVTYDVVFSTGPFIFGYAVDANWELPIKDPVEDPMVDFPPEANCPEAWKIEVTEEPVGSGLTNAGGQTMLTLDVYDWQGVATHQTPVVECPGIFEGSLDAELASDNGTYSRWLALIENDLLAAAGVYQCLISVEANENGPPLDWLDLTAYQIISLEVVETDVVAKADFEPDDPVVCQEIVFSDDGSVDTTGGTIINWEWDWENDGTFDDSGSPITHSFDDMGDHFVRYRVTSDSGLFGETILVVPVGNVLPTAIAEAPDAVDGHWWINTPLTFDASSSFDPDCGGQSIINYEWDWENDGTFTDTGMIIPHTFNLAQVYEVQLRVTDNENESATLEEPLVIECSIPDLPPVAKGKAEPEHQTVCEPVHFTDDGSYDQDFGLIVKWEWDWENDGTFDDEGPDLYHTWDIPGTYHVNLRVTDEEDDTDTLDEPLVVGIHNAPPVAIASADLYEVFEDEEIQFDGSDSYDIDCDGMEIVLYEWNFKGDGFYWADVGPTPTHTYTVYGNYYPDLRVTDDEGATATLEEPLHIKVNEYLKPIAEAIAIPPQQTVCEPVEFDATGSHPQSGDSIELYEWNFMGDGMYWVDAGPTPSYTYDHYGVYHVGLRVTDNNGSVGYLTPPLTLPIVNALPTAIATADQYEVMVDEPVHFDATESHDNDCGDLEIVRYDWSFTGDGYYYMDIGPTPTFSYSVFGIYNVNMRAFDDEGAYDILDEPLEIIVNPDTINPVAIADRNPPMQVVCEPILFYDNGSYTQAGDSIVKYEWDWDNDGFYDEEGVEMFHTWYETGIKYVNFRVTDNLGYTGELESPLMVVIMDNIPTAEAYADKYEAAPGEDIQFNGTESHDNDCSGEAIVLYEWDFKGNGYYWADAGPTPIHSYTAFGTYFPNLRVTDDEGSQAYLDTPLVINIVDNLSPVALADHDPDPSYDVCEQIYFFDNGSYPQAGDYIALHEWDWDLDGFYDQTGPEAFHTFDHPGTYSVQFRVTDNLGYTDELNHPMAVHIYNSLPTAVAEADNYFPETNQPVYFDGSMSYDNDCGGDYIALYEWDFNGGGIDWVNAGPAPVHAYSSVGVYYPWLRVTDDEGGMDYLDQHLEITVSGGDNSPPEITKVNHSRTTSERGNNAEAVMLSVDFYDPFPPGDTHTFLWTCDYGWFDDPTDPEPTWYPPDVAVECEISVHIIDSGGLWDDGTCNQWVTQWPILTNNPNAVNGSEVIPYAMKDVISDLMVNPADYPFPDVQPDGTVIFIDFWAIWANPSLLEMPLLTDIYNIYNGSGYQQMHIGMDSEETIEDWLADHPTYSASHWMVDPGSIYYTNCDDWVGTTAVPIHLVFDRDGNCRHAHLGAISNITQLTQYIGEFN